MVFENVTLPFNKVSTDAVHCVEHSQRKLAIIEISNLCHLDSNSFRHSCSLRILQATNPHDYTKPLKYNEYLIWTAYVLSTYLISYTMGQMQSAPFHDDLLAVWAVFLVIFLGNANSISAYNLEENEIRKSYNFVVLIQCLWTQFLIFTFRKEIVLFQAALNLLNYLSVVRTGERFKALKLASRSYGLVRSSKLVADFDHDL